MEQGQKAKTRLIHPSHDELYQFYVIENKTAVELGALYGMNHTTLLCRLRERNISIRTNSEIHKGKIITNETREKMSESSKGNTKWLGRHHSKGSISKIREYHLGNTIPEDVRQKMSITHKKLFQNPKHKERILKAVRSALNIHPNKPETIVQNLLNEIAPNDWAFVGNGQVVIEGKNPDFINVNGKKQILEVFGDYWHGERARCYEETEEGRIALFKKYGYSTLVIWESELKDIVKVVDKIKEFVNNK